MKPFKFFWTTHKWTGILFSIFFLTVAVTGFLLIMKKEWTWVQPPTQKGSEGELKDFLTMERLFTIVFEQNNPNFKSMDDIDRVDMRPGKRVYKVRSVHNHAELQVDAISGKILSDTWRASDLIEQIHDGSWMAEWFHDFFMPFVSFAIIFLVFSGLWLWLEPIIKKWRRKAKKG